MVDAEINPIDVSNNEEDNEVKEMGKYMDIWKDETCMVLLSKGTLDQVLDVVIEVDRTKRRFLNYHWRKDTLLFKNVVMPKLEDKNVATLALGSRPRQGVARLWAKKETRESHHMLLGVQRVCRNEPSHSQVNFHYGS
jgi:hypothetical protein